MPRTARLVVPDVSVHIVQRGHNAVPCFARTSDYRTYLRYLAKFATRFECAVHAYCLMTNHVHLLVTPRRTESCALLMKHLGQCYVQTLNMALGRKGTLWESRFYSCLVPSESYVLACYRYIELNPVRAGLARAPADYSWSSHKANAGMASDPLLSRHPALDAVPASYRALFDEPLAPPVLEEIRRATRKGQGLGAPVRRRGRPPGKPPETGSVPISAETGSVPN